MSTELRLGTRGSQLAIWQANTVAARIAAAGGPPCRLVVIRTSGDRLQEAPISDVGGKRLFVKEIEDALIRREIDLAVHSSKDMTAILPEGLVIAGVLPREDPLDAVVLPAQGSGLRAQGSRLTASPHPSARAACGASHNSRGCCPARVSRRFAATSTRDCANLTRAITA